MYRIPPKRAKPRTRKDNGDLPQHRAFVRGHPCTVVGCQSNQIECAHCRVDLPPGEHGGTGFKPHDKWTMPLCAHHHRQQHRGERTFSKWLWDNFKIDPIEVASAFWQASPVRKRLEVLARS